jgi:hypothetical protein
MKTFKLLDIMLQALLICFVVLAFLFSSYDLKWVNSFLLIGLYQLFSFILLSLPSNKKKLRIVYFLMLLVVFSPIITRNLPLPRDNYAENKVYKLFEMSDQFYYCFVCPVVMFYYFVVSVLEYREMKKDNQIA